MKLSVVGLLGVMFGAVILVGCGERGPGAKAPVGTTTISSAPMVPDPQFSLPAVTWDDDATDEPVNVVETWGARPPTPEELDKYGF